MSSNSRSIVLSKNCRRRPCLDTIALRNICKSLAIGTDSSSIFYTSPRAPVYARMSYFLSWRNHPVEVSIACRDVVVAFGGTFCLGEIVFGEAVEPGAAGQDPAGDVPIDAGIGQHPVRHLGEARIEMREVARHADIVGTAQQLHHRADLALATLDRREAVALPVFERRQLQIGRVGIVVLPQIPFDASQQPRHPPALRFEK